MYTHLEDYINDIYKMMNISKPSELNMYFIAQRLGIEIIYRKAPFRYGSVIALSYGTIQQRWQTFGHELCHYLVHYGQQLHMHPLFRDLQEYQSNRFAYHFCVPTFMLQQIKEVTVYKIMNLFNVEFDFALHRLEMYKNKFYKGRIYHALQ